MTILDDIVACKKDEVARAKQETSLASLEALATAQGPTRGFAASLQRQAASGGIGLIAEIKKASPSKGVIRADFDPVALARAFADGGATCLSVLTDGPSFQGALGDLRDARAAARLPALRKDFMIDDYQVAQARAYGADCILLIMAILKDTRARDLESAATRYGMDVLIECHNETEIARALKLDSPLIGVNNRDLATFRTSLAVTERLAPLIPRARLLVSESGIATAADLARVRAAGAGAALVGESLMRSDDVAGATRALMGGNRLA